MIKSIKSFFKLHYQSIFIFASIFIILLPIILSKQLNNLDEIWNYNFARNISNGLIPYKDFNMITPPLLPFICGIILKIFNNELLVMRILAVLLNSFIFFMCYKILKKLNVNLFYNISSIFLLFLLLKDYICIDYNFSVLLFILILIYLELKYLNENYFNNHFYIYLLLGFLSGCCILFKQSTGLIVTIITIFYPIFFIKNKVDLKNYFKITLMKLLGILVPIILVLIYLIKNNAFSYFIDYAILGINTFANSISYSNLIESSNIPIKMLSILIPTFILITGIYLLKARKKNLYSFYCYSLSSLVVIFPISDNIHFLIGITPFLILFFYLLFKVVLFIYNKLNNKFKIFLKHMLQMCIIISLSSFIITSCIDFISYLNCNEKNHNIKYYKNIPISETLLNKINEVDDYILSEKNSVYILDAEAAIYMIPIDKYNKDFDMFLKGNLGKNGEEGQIEKIKSLDSGTIILIKKDKYKKNWQTPLEVINFIKNNYFPIGEINIFDIYEIE